MDGKVELPDCDHRNRGGWCGVLLRRNKPVRCSVVQREGGCKELIKQLKPGTMYWAEGEDIDI